MRYLQADSRTFASRIRFAAPKDAAYYPNPARFPIATNKIACILANIETPINFAYVNCYKIYSFYLTDEEYIRNISIVIVAITKEEL